MIELVNKPEEKDEEIKYVVSDDNRIIAYKMSNFANINYEVELSSFIDNFKERLATLEKKINNQDKIDIKDIMINYHREKYPYLLPAEKHGNFYDLRSAVFIELRKGKQALIPLGVSINLPDGYYATLLPRSSTFKKHGILIANSVGIIDSN